MSGQLDVSGTLIAGPPNATDTTFPSMQASASIHTTPTPKGWQVCTGVLSRTINSPSSYVTLDGIGAAKTVTAADFLYLRSNTKLKVRITQVDGIGTLVGERYVSGLLIHEAPSDCAITLVEVQGSATIEYLASGQS